MEKRRHAHSQKKKKSEESALFSKFLQTCFESLIFIHGPCETWYSRARVLYCTWHSFILWELQGVFNARSNVQYVRKRMARSKADRSFLSATHRQYCLFTIASLAFISRWIGSVYLHRRSHVCSQKKKIIRTNTHDPCFCLYFPPSKKRFPWYTPIQP